MKKNTYTLFWMTGESVLVEGYDVSDAMNCAGYGAGSVRALDFWANGDQRNNYVFDKEKSTWVKTIKS